MFGHKVSASSYKLCISSDYVLLEQVFFINMRLVNVHF